MSDERAAADALDRYWNGLVRNVVTFESDVEPSLLAAARHFSRLGAIEAESTPDRDFLRRLRSEVATNGQVMPERRPVSAPSPWRQPRPGRNLPVLRGADRLAHFTLAVVIA